MITATVKTTDRTGKLDAYRTLTQEEWSTDPADVEEALERLGVIAARDAVIAIGQQHGLDWMDQNPEWKRNAWIRAVLKIERAIGRSLTSYQRHTVRRGMKPILDDAI